MMKPSRGNRLSHVWTCPHCAPAVNARNFQLLPKDTSKLVCPGRACGREFSWRVGSRSSQLGLPFFTIIADWLADRAAGKPFESTYNVVDRTGQLHREPWGEQRRYQHGAPLGVEQLYTDKPPTGAS